MPPQRTNNHNVRNSATVQHPFQARSGTAGATGFRASEIGDRGGPPVIRALVVAPLQLYRDGIAEGLRGAPTIAEVATCRPSESMATFHAFRPDITILDPVGVDGLAIVRALKVALLDARVVVLGVGDSEADIIAWAEAGASGFVGKEETLPDLLTAVVAAANAELQCSPKLAGALCRRVSDLAGAAAGARDGGLTAREREVAKFVQLGLTNKEIARRLCIQTATVKNHVHSILTKLGATRRGEAAMRLRAVHPELLETPPQSGAAATH
jgi:two-component system, NarL family, nitrate/nitrite response regulator NarL